MSIKAMLSRNRGVNGQLQVQGGVPVPDLELEKSENFHTRDKAEQLAPDKQKLLDIGSLLSEANAVSDTTPTSTTPQTSITPTATQDEEQEYDPTKPLLPTSTSFFTLPDLLNRIASTHRVRAERDRTPRYVHNGFLLSHIFANTPSTRHLCQRCTARRKCAHHRKGETFRQQTSISLCQHLRLVLTWAVDDPVNAKSTWTLETRSYFDIISEYASSTNHPHARGDHYDPRAEERERKYHDEHCVLHSAELRVQLLAERVVEDFRRERKPLRGNVRRVADEIRALLDALQRADRQRRDKEDAHKKFEHVLGGVIRPVTTIPHHQHSSSPSPPDPRQQHTPPTPPTYNPPSSPLFKRKRSSLASNPPFPSARGASLLGETSPRKLRKMKEKKSVKWAIEVDTNTNIGVERVRMMSPEVEGARVKARELLLSPVVSDDEDE